MGSAAEVQDFAPSSIRTEENNDENLGKIIFT